MPDPPQALIILPALLDQSLMGWSENGENRIQGQLKPDWMATVPQSLLQGPCRLTKGMGEKRRRRLQEQQ